MTPPYYPESNRVAERNNRTLKEMMNSLLVSASAHDNLWSEAILSAFHLQNKIPYKKRGKTCKTRENSIFLKRVKKVILVENQEFF